MSLLERCAGTVFILMIIRRYTSIWKMTTYRKNNLETWQQIERMESFLLEGEEEVAEVWNTMNWAGSSTTLWCRNQCPPSKFPLDQLLSTPITTGSKSTTPFSTWKKEDWNSFNNNRCREVYKPAMKIFQNISKESLTTVKKKVLWQSKSQPEIQEKRTVHSYEIYSSETSSPRSKHCPATVNGVGQVK